MAKTAVLERETFTTSRLLEFFSEKELSMQIGFRRPDWALALLKELIDNALDACECSGVAPVIEVEIEKNTVSVRDNGPGIPADTIKRSLDYSVRVSDKSYYVSPTRGQLGNALKCLWAAPCVITGDHGRVEVHAHGQAHTIDVRLDRIAQEPKISHSVTDSVVKNGTFIKFGWPGIAIAT
jgi:DNA topoisomerase VI subunit B